MALPDGMSARRASKDGSFFSVGKVRRLCEFSVGRYGTSMTNKPTPDEGLVITFDPDATPEEMERFISEMAYALLALARYLVSVEEEGDLGTIRF
jgi:hypothetical protein